MDIKEAYSILEVSENISDDDLKVKHRELVFKYHPDKYKEDPDKLSKINSAYQLITEYRENPEKFQQQMPGGFGVSLDDIFSNLGFGFGGNSDNHRSPGRSAPPPSATINISFKESVIGCDKEISYSRIAKCDKCDGKGVQLISNGCNDCNGFGRVMQQRPGIMFSSNCTKCHSRGIKNNKCDKCNASGGIKNDITCNIRVPPGIPSNTSLTLQHAGHFMGGSMFGEAYGPVDIKVMVEPDKELRLVGQDVVLDINISLLEALTGCKKTVRTIYDPCEIEIKALSKHGDEIIIKEYGVPPNGVQKIIINVEYPENVDGLIGYLKGRDEKIL